jgi:putative nucleotidyltransferase with HDIG domain
MALPATPEPGSPCPDLVELAAELPWLAAMAGTEQDPVHHGEGDVLRHTQLVAEVLVADEAWQRLEPEDRGELWLATLLHDVGTPATTRYENGRWTAPGHARRGAILARRILWEAGLSPFASDHARFSYFTHADRDPAYAAHDDTHSRVVVLSGLPGAGKDRWIATHHGGRPTISLDDLRRRRGAKRSHKVSGRASHDRSEAKAHFRRLASTAMPSQTQPLA